MILMIDSNGTHDKCHCQLEFQRLKYDKDNKLAAFDISKLTQARLLQRFNLNLDKVVLCRNLILTFLFLFILN